jgi:hypothetical protein
MYIKLFHHYPPINFWLILTLISIYIDSCTYHKIQCKYVRLVPLSLTSMKVLITIALSYYCLLLIGLPTSNTSPKGRTFLYVLRVNCQTDLVTNFIFSTSLPKKNRLIWQTLVDIKQTQIGNSLLILISSFERKERCSVLKSKCTIIHGYLHLTGTVFSKLCNWQKPYAPPPWPTLPTFSRRISKHNQTLKTHDSHFLWEKC